MTIALSANTPRISYTVNAGATQTAFTVPFVFFDGATDLNVFVDNTARTFHVSTANTTQFTVSGGSGSTGAITTSVTGASGGSTVVITRDVPLARTTDFPSSGAFEIAKLNTELDTLTVIQSDFNDQASRGIRLKDSDVAVSMELPLKADRIGTVLGFNASTGAVEAGPTITAVQSLSAVTASINLLGTSAVVEDMGLLATSAVIEDMGLLATSGNVTAMGLLGVSGVITDMGILGTAAIVEDMGFLGTSANVTAMGHLGTSANVTAMGKLGNDATVADMAILGTDDVVADMNTLATSDIIADLNTLATSDIVTDMNLLATSANVTAMGLLGTSANVTAMGLLGTSAVVTDLGLLATSAVIEDMGLLATSAVIEDMGILGTSANVTAMSNVSGAIANVNIVASNVSGVNSFADRYRVASSAPSSSLDVGDLYFDTTANELKVYKSSGWAAAGSTVNGTSARFHYDISGTPQSVTGNDAAGNTLAYDAGFCDVYVNGVRMSTADITITSGDTVTFASALANGDEVDIVAFGTFSVSNIVSTGALNSGSITSGFGNIDTGSSTITTTGVGTFGSLDISGNIDVDGTTNLDVVDIDGAVDMASTLGVAGVVTANAGVVVDNITIDGTEIDLSSGDLTLDIASDLIIDVDDGRIFFKDGGTTFGRLANSSSDFEIVSVVADKDILFKGNDNGSEITALTLDMSSAGQANFNAGLGIGGTGAANTLNDYEEGTFTPTWTSSGSSFQYTVQQGIYTKIGNRVCFTIYVQLDGGGNSFSSNAVTLGGFPFTSSETMYYPVLGRYLNSDTGNSYYDPCILLNSGGTTAPLRQLGDNVQGVASAANVLSNASGQVWISGTYRTDL